MMSYRSQTSKIELAYISKQQYVEREQKDEKLRIDIGIEKTMTSSYKQTSRSINQDKKVYAIYVLFSWSNH